LKYNINDVMFKVNDVTLGGEPIGYAGRALLERKYR
jgi:hypothetical protein